MEGSNYSGASYPPSMYDTSVSSASASRRNAGPLHGGYNEREDPQFMHQYPNDYHQQGYSMYSRSPRSFDNSRYNRDITAMSDPGAAMPERIYRSQVEYAQSEIGSPSSVYYERQHPPIRHFEEERYGEPRHQYSHTRYPSAPDPRRSASPSLEQQRSQEHMLQQMYYGDGEFNSRDNYGRVNEGYNDGMYNKPSSTGRRSSDSSSNMKELRRQFVNKRDPSPPRYDRKIQQSLSPERRPQRASSSPSINLERYARSLSPRRRQYQPSSPMVNESPSQVRKANSMVDESPSRIRKASSTMSDTSYNSRFNSKFVEAAMNAQKRGGGNDRDHEVEGPQRHHVPQYQQQRKHRSQSFSSPQSFRSRPLNDSDSKPHRFIPSPSHSHYSSNQNSNGEAHKKVSQYQRGNDSYGYKSVSRGSSETRRPPTKPPSPSSTASSSPPTTSNGRQERHQQHFVPMDHDRSKDSPQILRRDGSARRIRPPSPNLMDRIRSFENEYHNDSTRAVSESRIQVYEREPNRHDYERAPSDSWHGVKHRGNDSWNNYNGNEVARGNDTRNQYIANEADARRPHSDRFQHHRSNQDYRKDNPGEFSSPVINRQHTNGGSNSKRQQNEMQRSPDASESDQDRMATLVDKLSAVNRQDPQSALAQIDSILREESRSRGSNSFSNDAEKKKDVKPQQRHQEYPNESNMAGRIYEDNGEEENYNNADDDDSSDVSSITNPTFQQGTSRSNNAKNVDSLYIRENGQNDHYNMYSTAPSNNLGFNPSTSSFRRPRPSQLQNYSNDTSKDPTMSRSEWKRQQLQKFPPPTTIKLKDDQDSNESPGQNSAEIRERMLQKNIEASRANQRNQGSGETLRSRQPEKPRTKPDKPKKKLDTFMSDKHELAEKIRGWDELSNQNSKSRSEPDESLEVNQSKKDVRQSIAAFSKSHPWDNRTNTVQTKDTSMENADGIEASISDRAYMRELDVDADISLGGSRVPSPSQGNHFAKARRNIRDRRDTNPFNDDSVESSDRQADTNIHYPDLLNADKGEVPAVEISMNGIPQFNHQEQLTPSGTHLNGEGSSWVEMPPSSFFPDINDSKSSRKPSVVSNPMVTSGGQVSLQQDDPRSIARLACKTVSPKEPKRKEKKRGFLQKFMEKKKANGRSVGYTASASGGSYSGHSVSLESRGVKSASYVETSSRPVPQASFQILGPPPGVSASVQNVPRGRSNPRNAKSSSPRRSRSKSSDKFRSNSMAQKFNRVMQLYDSDEI